MSDPLRRDPTNFLRVLKRMATTSHWQKSLLFCSRGRMLGFDLGIEHYNLCLYSQAVWGRAMEICSLIDAMKKDEVRPNAVSYYYIINGMANADHGYGGDFNINFQLERVQHWRIALDALQCCKENGYDATSAMYNSCIVTCTIPTMNQWVKACHVLHEMCEEGHPLHPQMTEFFHKCLLRNRRAVEARNLMELAQAGGAGAKKGRPVEPAIVPGPVVALTEEENAIVAQEMGLLEVGRGGVPPDAGTIFRPMVWRGQWWKWHKIANKYRPTETLRKRQLAPRWSPAGIPGWNKQ